LADMVADEAGGAGEEDRHAAARHSGTDEGDILIPGVLMQMAGGAASATMGRPGMGECGPQERRR
jgi:hypothetical protein